jgi:TPP-dependent pyruvate/acetoin dehydrogenase alpha subunit
VRIENNDTLRINELVRRAVDEIRAGESGPRFFECMTYRWKEHVGYTDDFYMGYRSKEEMAPWVEGDQLKVLGGLLDNETRLSIERSVEEELTAAIEFAEQSEFPDVEELHREVFREV